MQLRQHDPAVVTFDSWELTASPRCHEGMLSLLPGHRSPAQCVPISPQQTSAPLQILARIETKTTHFNESQDHKDDKLPLSFSLFRLPDTACFPAFNCRSGLSLMNCSWTGLEIIDKVFSNYVSWMPVDLVKGRIFAKLFQVSNMNFELEENQYITLTCPVCASQELKQIKKWTQETL